jgi:hypothetical protein
MSTILKRELLELVGMVNTVKTWILLNIPKIEDGNNFGVSIQEEVVTVLGRVEDAWFLFLDNTARYYSTRAKLQTKVLCSYAIMLSAPYSMCSLLSAHARIDFETSFCGRLQNVTRSVGREGVRQPSSLLPRHEEQHRCGVRHHHQERREAAQASI